MLASYVICQTRKIVSEAFFLSTGNGTSGVIDITRNIKNEKCFGEATISGSIDNKSGSISGGLTFCGYHLDGVAISGEVFFHCRTSSECRRIESFEFNFENVDATCNRASTTMDGEICMRESGTSATVTMSAYITDNLSSRTYWADNYIGTATANGHKTSVNLHGSFYSPVYGYVEIATLKPFVVGQGLWPTSGIISFEGLPRAGGGPAMALITAYSNGYEALVDTDGDGRFEWISERLHWTS